MRLDQSWIEPPERRVLAADVRAGRAAPGPVLERLRLFPRVRTPVMGTYAELSPDGRELQEHIASGAAERLWQSMGCRSVTEARSQALARVRREWGVVGFLCTARLIALRLPEIGLTREESDAGRARRAEGPGEVPLDEARYAAAAAELFAWRLDPHAPQARF